MTEWEKTERNADNLRHITHSRDERMYIKHDGDLYDGLERITHPMPLAEYVFYFLFRHTYVVGALEGGDDIKTVLENLDHRAASFTLDVCGHVTERMRKRSAESMAKRTQKGTGTRRDSTVHIVYVQHQGQGPVK